MPGTTAGAAKRSPRPRGKQRNLDADMNFAPYSALAFAMLLRAAMDCRSARQGISTEARAWLCGPQSATLCAALGMDVAVVHWAVRAQVRKKEA